MKIKNQDELLAFFMDGGCMLDKKELCVYISDVNADGHFFGIMGADGLPEDECGNVIDACQYALDNIPAPGAFGAKNRMWLIDAPGCEFDELSDDFFSRTDDFELSETEKHLTPEKELSLKRDAYIEAYARVFQYVVNELDGRDEMFDLSPLDIAVNYIDMELSGTTLIAAMNGVDDAMNKILELAKPDYNRATRID